jgi:hypothetical protein
MNLVLRPAAASDLDEAFLWYESQREGLGEEFLVAVTRVMEVLAESPAVSHCSPGNTEGSCEAIPL